MRVGVIGGGIGGLTTALALVRKGIDVTVYERAPELREIGAGIALWPAPLAVLDTLGVGDDVRALSGPWTDAGLRRANGDYLVHYTADQFAARLGETIAGVHRGELQAVLLRALPDGVLHLNHELTGLTTAPDGATITFADGTTAEVDAVIAADGRRSKVREITFGSRPLHDCKSLGWRGSADEPPDADWHSFAGETWGVGGRFGILPISNGRVTWYGVARQARAGGGLDEIADRFGTWHDPIPSLIAATKPEHLWADVIDDLRPLRRWTAGPIALLGDAAHPMTPELGQGACQAILDASVIADELATEAKPAEAFRAYEKRRRRRAAMVTLVARAATASARTEGRVAVGFRSRVASLGSPKIMLRQLELLSRGP
jgi:2-polyprenyl-6-methoxyphenol hydroxylase-like FAD-dependent oxidoreductase